MLLKEQDQYRSPEIRAALLISKKQGIPAYLYTSQTAWRLQDRRRAVNLTNASALLKGQQPNRSYRPIRNYLEDWLELIFKKSKDELTQSARDAAQSLVYYGQGYRNEDGGLGTVLSNARKPSNSDYPSAVKIADFMRRNNLKTSVELKNYLADKWANLW